MGGQPAVEARRLIDSASFGPDALKALSQAFDEAWADIEGNFGCDRRERQPASSLRLHSCPSPAMTAGT